MREPLYLTEVYTERLNRLLAARGLSLADAPRLAGAVRKLSDFYIERPHEATPWHEEWAVLAYLCYFFPLNYLRVRSVLRRAEQLGFAAGLDTYVDFGSGVGTVSLALDDTWGDRLRSGHVIERAATPIALHKQLLGPTSIPLTWLQKAPAGGFGPRRGRLTCFSFALTELAQIPAWALDSEALMLIEPATNQDSRRLLAWREELLAGGWHVWGPCTHAGACPLLHESKRDWCHDRLAWQPSAWFSAIEEHLPMRNGSLTMSYLLLRRTPPSADLSGLGRLTGDLKREKGASRQMLCRGPKREFLSWQHKHGEAPAWPRGELVTIAPQTLVKSNELRPSAGQVALACVDGVAPVGSAAEVKTNAGDGQAAAITKT